MLTAERNLQTRRQYTELLLRRIILKAKTDASQTSTSESLSQTFIGSKNSLWPDDHITPMRNLSDCVLVEWQCSAELHMEWKHKQKTAFREPIATMRLQGEWGGSSGMELYGTQVNINRRNEPYCFISNYCPKDLLLPSTPSYQHWYCLEQNKACGQGRNNKADSTQDY